MSAADPFTPLDALFLAEDVLLDGLELLDSLARELVADPLIDWALAGSLAAVTDLAAEDRIWEEPVQIVRHWLAGSRPDGPLVVGEQVWCCGAQAVMDLVARTDDAVWLYPPLGQALQEFNHAFFQYRRTLAEDETDPDADLPPEAAVVTEAPPGRFMVHRPSERIVLHAVWAGPDAEGARIEPVVTDEVMARAWAVRRAWTNGRRAIERVFQAHRGHLPVGLVARLRAEVEWECARAVTAWELKLSGGEGNRPRNRPVQPPPAHRDERMEERDRWIYDQVMEGNLTYEAIMRRLRREAAMHGWRALGSAEAIRQRATRCAEQNNLPAPPSRQNR
jgi:hypothetical protein